MRNIEIVFRHDTERTNSSQRSAVFAIELVDAVAIDDQLALVTARQVEIAHQAIPRIVFIAVARVIHAWPFIAAIPRVVSAWIGPSGVGHRPLLARRDRLGCP
jgi:hypothetical protein